MESDRHEFCVLGASRQCGRGYRACPVHGDVERERPMPAIYLLRQGGCELRVTTDSGTKKCRPYSHFSQYQRASIKETHVCSVFKCHFMIPGAGIQIDNGLHTLYLRSKRRRKLCRPLA